MKKTNRLLIASLVFMPLLLIAGKRGNSKKESKERESETYESSGQSVNYSAFPIQCPRCKNTFSYDLPNETLSAPGITHSGSLKCKGCKRYFYISISFDGEVTVT